MSVYERLVIGFTAKIERNLAGSRREEWEPEQALVFHLIYNYSKLQRSTSTWVRNGD